MVGYIVQIGGNISRGNFSENEAGKSSTWRELKGTLNVLSSLVEIIHSQILKHQTDNKNVVTVLSIGSTKSDLQELVVNIFKFCIRHNIQLVPKWVPREENEISKMVDHDDYMLSPDIFAALDIMWCPQWIGSVHSIPGRYPTSVVNGGIWALKQLMLSQSHGSQKTTGCFLHHT